MFLKDYYKALEDADEKVQLANQIYDLVSKCQSVFLFKNPYKNSGICLCLTIISGNTLQRAIMRKC